MTPSYNQGRYIERTIQSVLAQQYPNLEYFVIDGASQDETVDVIKRYQDRIDYWVSERDRGQSQAINKGMAMASGEILAWLNSDDWLEPLALARVAEHARASPDAGAFVGHGRMVNHHGKLVLYKKPGELTFERFCQWCQGGDFMQPSCFFRRSAWELAGPLDESIHFALDVDLWLRMVKVTRFEQIDALLSTALAHEAAKTTACWSEMFVDASIVIVRAGGERFIRKRLVELTAAGEAFEQGPIRNHPLIRPMVEIARPAVQRARRFWRRSVAHAYRSIGK